MTYIERILAEIDRQILKLGGEEPSDFCEGAITQTKYFKRFISNLPKEPASDDLEQASKEWLRPQLDKSYADYGERKMMELTHFDGYAMLDAVEFGAQWQKEQMKKDAIEGGCFSYKRMGMCISPVILTNTLLI